MKKNIRRILSMGLAAAMGVSVLAGCSGSGSGSSGTSGEPGQAGSAAAENGTGRYVEEQLTPPFDEDGENMYTSILDMRVLTDGKVRLLYQKTTYEDEGDDYDQSVIMTDSEDGGKTWKESSALSDLAFMEAEKDHHVDIENAAIGPDGQLFLRVRNSYYTETEEGDMIRSEGTESYSHYMISEDGTATPITIDIPELPNENSWSYEYPKEGSDEGYYTEETEADEAGEDDIIISENGEDGQREESTSYLNAIKFADAENLYLLTDEGGIYHYDLSEGKVAGEAHAADYIETVGIAGNELIVVSWDKAEGYDIETGQKKGEYPELTKALQEVRGSYYLGDSAESGKVYYVGNSGIFSYDLASGESTMIVDGKLTSLVSTEVNILYFLVKPDGEYMILMSDYMNQPNSSNLLMNYSFDPDMPARPDKHLTVYSLQEDYWVEQVIAMFQKSHPDIYIDIVYGMSGDDAVTSSDAIRTLNTQVMAGEGPDIIFLEGLPTAAYVDKGVLMDLTDQLTKAKSENTFFETILDTYKTERGTFAIPSSFSVPVIIGHHDLLDSIHSVEDLAAEASRFADDPDKGENRIFMESYEMFSLIGTLMPTNSGSWFKEDGSLEPQLLKDYLTNIRNINENLIRSSDNTDEMMQSLKESLMDEEFREFLTYTNMSGSDPTWDAIAIAAGSNMLGLGKLAGVQGLEYMYSAAKTDEDLEFRSMPGAIENVYIPENAVGINAKTADPDSAGEFLSYMLTTDVQKYMAQYQGFPVNMAAFDKAMEDPQKNQPGYEPGKSSGSVGAVDENGKEVTMDLYWPDEEYISSFKTRLNELSTPAYDDEVILTTILKDCLACVLGDEDIDAAVDQVMKDINIYLSE